MAFIPGTDIFPNPTSVDFTNPDDSKAFILNLLRILNTNIHALNLADMAPQKLTNTGIPQIADYDIQLKDQIVFIDATLGAINVTLPPPSLSFERTIVIKKVDTANIVTLLPFDTETIDGASGFILSAPNMGAVCMYCDGTNWFVLNYYLG